MDANVKRCVIDASFVLSFLLPDEKNDQITAIFQNFLQGKINFISHPLLPYEVLNSLKIAVLRKRLSADLAKQISVVFLRYHIQFQPIDFHAVFLLAEKYNLTFYDASYLYLSQSQNLPLLTLDKHLIPFSSKLAS